MLEHLVKQRRAISLYETLPDRLHSNEWHLTERIVALLEPVTKELSAKGAMVSQVIPFLKILKMELDWLENFCQPHHLQLLQSLCLVMLES